MKKIIALALALLSTVALADTKIANLPAAGALNGTEVYPLQQTGCSVLTGDTCQTTLGTMANFVETQLTSSEIIGLFSGCSGTKYLGADGACHSVLTTPVTVPNGGTGVATLTAHGVLVGEGTGNVVATAAMAADTVLQGQGGSADPTAASVPNCGSSTQALNYSTSSHAFGCQTITASGVGTTVVASSDVTATSLTTPAADSALTFSSVSTGSHLIECSVSWTTTGTGMGLKAGLGTTGTVDSGGTMWQHIASDNGTTITPFIVNGQGMSNTASDGTISSSLPSSTSVLQVTWHASVTLTVSGNVSVYWSQNSSVATALTRRKGSWCTLN